MNNNLIDSILSDINKASEACKKALYDAKDNGNKLTEDNCIDLAESMLALINSAQQTSSMKTNDEIGKRSNGISFDVKFYVALFLAYLGYFLTLKQVLPSDKISEALKRVKSDEPKEACEHLKLMEKKIKEVDLFTDWFADKLIADFRSAGIDTSKLQKEMQQTVEDLKFV